ncbi:ABC transporter ATP-binding protein [Vibrio genomosp. F10]|uniref:ABC transporter ATP-binding protein n=2 Tax=Vibrio genomosp. F10 TaxID=723171 RepID=A0A1B9QV91_9VIBR|nr:ABC transporter ATP-binding protein [Vibrio genomosp. F10]OCH72819.1 ABC transporter ATP-binding protein [Vibrio genomosp. F10]OEE31317.1 ABC transporter ATP-binding protein [Vibrio genomosp. F10 str. ZF-129]OEE96516.1 ABC transporter ATP-binding protein [Vibrio genomosp. F10 str. 9ZC157]OEF06735.1 ABC transporter ATP-binding protein [Vibrio genomosp. F10 str. 9ZD137]OEF10634.1 ABC transporter ATP-binding protein [Vibrio genomosp. F10 str. 9ZB36]
MQTSIISTKSVSKVISNNRESLTILNDIDMDVKEGESIAIVGTSGAGKSTLMTLLAGLDTPTSGSIELLGKSISQMSDDERASLRANDIGFVFQSFLLVPTLSAIDNVTLPCLLNGSSVDKERAKMLLGQVGLTNRMEHLPSQLSGGEQQRVALARAFMINPKILFADEPTGNLDQKTAATVIDLLFDMNKQHGTTLILVTHDLSLAEQCDRTIYVQSGSIQPMPNSLQQSAHDLLQTEASTKQSVPNGNDIDSQGHSV